MKILLFFIDDSMPYTPGDCVFIFGEKNKTKDICRIELKANIQVYSGQGVHFKLIQKANRLAGQVAIV